MDEELQDKIKQLAQWLLENNSYYFEQACEEAENLLANPENNWTASQIGGEEYDATPPAIAALENLIALHEVEAPLKDIDEAIQKAKEVIDNYA